MDLRGRQALCCGLGLLRVDVGCLEVGDQLQFGHGRAGWGVPAIHVATGPGGPKSNGSNAVKRSSISLRLRHKVSQKVFHLFSDSKPPMDQLINLAFTRLYHIDHRICKKAD